MLNTLWAQSSSPSVHDDPVRHIFSQFSQTVRGGAAEPQLKYTQEDEEEEKKKEVVSSNKLKSYVQRLPEIQWIV